MAGVTTEPLAERPRNFTKKDSKHPAVIRQETSMNQIVAFVRRGALSKRVEITAFRVVVIAHQTLILCAQPR